MRDSPQRFSVTASACSSDPPTLLQLGFYGLKLAYEVPGLLLAQIPPDLGPLVRLCVTSCLHTLAPWLHLSPVGR